MGKGVRLLVPVDEKLSKELKEITIAKRFEIQNHIEDDLTRGHPRMTQWEKDFIIKHQMKYWRGYEKTINEKKHKRD